MACWIPEATDTYSEYVIPIFYDNNGYANAPGCYFYTYTGCLVKSCGRPSGCVVFRNVGVTQPDVCSRLYAVCCMLYAVCPVNRVLLLR